MQYPIYILEASNNTAIVAPPDRKDLDHSEFWETIVHKMVAAQYKIPSNYLFDLTYCMKRARIVGENLYYGEQQTPELLKVIRDSLQDQKLVFMYDDHEKRLKEDVRVFRRLLRRYNPMSMMT